MEINHHHEQLDIEKVADRWTVEAVAEDPATASVMITVMALHIKYLRDKVRRSGNAYSNAGSGKRRGW